VIDVLSYRAWFACLEQQASALRDAERSVMPRVVAHYLREADLWKDRAALIAAGERR
jgi:hypothetical protein